MTDETNAQTLAGLAEGTTTTETQETKTPKAQDGQAEETKQPDSTVTNTDAAENGEQSSVDDDAETEGQEERKPKRSRSDRYKSRIAALAAENAELQQRLNAGEQPKKDAPKPPKIEDFNYDQQAFDDARLAYNTEQAVSKAINETRREDQQSKLRETRAELVEEFMEGVESIKERIPDYDKVLASANVDMRPDVGDLILSSEKGPHLAYELAKNNGAKLRELNAMTPVEAARFIGRLEARLSLPSPKKQTQAPAPIKPPVGGAAPSRDVASLAQSEDAGDYIAAMNARQKG